MGSPLRVSGVAEGTDTAGSCRTYGYDEFGNDLSDTIGKELEETGIPNPYTAQGEGQPFGYTGYRYDRTSGTYFAQAREYRPETGRFHAQDVVAGNGAAPVTLNRYTYCLGNPVGYTDYDGMKGYYFYDPLAFTGLNAEGKSMSLDIDKIVEADIKNLEKVYNTTIELIPMNSQSNDKYTSFSDAWNNMDDSNENIDVVVISTHANNNYFVTDSVMDGDRRKTTGQMYRGDIAKLKDKNVDTLLLVGCSMGIKDQLANESKDRNNEEIDFSNNSLASQFYAADYRKNIGQIIAANGSVMHGIDKDGKRIIYAVPNRYDGTESAAFRRYYIEDGQLIIDEDIDIRTYMGDISDEGYEDDCEQGGKKFDKKL